MQGCFCLRSVGGVHMALKQDTLGVLISGEFASLLVILWLDEGGMRQQVT